MPTVGIGLNEIRVHTAMLDSANFHPSVAYPALRIVAGSSEVA